MEFLLQAKRHLGESVTDLIGVRGVSHNDRKGITAYRYRGPTLWGGCLLSIDMVAGRLIPVGASSGYSNIQEDCAQGQSDELNDTRPRVGGPRPGGQGQGNQQNQMRGHGRRARPASISDAAYQWGDRRATGAREREKLLHRPPAGRLARPSRYSAPHCSRRFSLGRGVRRYPLRATSLSAASFVSLSHAI